MTRCSLSSFCGFGFRAVALEAELVGTRRAQQVLVVAAVRLVAGRASLLECRLVQVRLLHLLGLIAVARQARIHRIGLQ